MTKARGCLFAAVGALALLSAAAALVAPRVLREGRRFYEPVVKLKRAEVEFKRLESEHPWKAPAQPALGVEQLDRFLSLRARLADVFKGVSFDPDALEGREPDVRAVGEALEGVGDLVSRQLDAFVQAKMTPAEYHYVEKLVYGQWRPALQRAGTYPPMIEVAARELDAAAAGEKRADMARRLREIGAGLRARTPPAPEGWPHEVHALLLTRVAEIERLSLDEHRELARFR